MAFLGHNFGPRHARMSIMGSKEADDRLVSKKCLNDKSVVPRASLSGSKI